MSGPLSSLNYGHHYFTLLLMHYLQYRTRGVEELVEHPGGLLAPEEHRKLLPALAREVREALAARHDAVVVAVVDPGQPPQEVDGRLVYERLGGH